MYRELQIFSCTISDRNENGSAEYRCHHPRFSPGTPDIHSSDLALSAGSLVSLRVLICTALPFVLCEQFFFIIISIPSQAGSENTNTGSSGPAREKEQEQDLFPQQEAENEHGDCYLPV